MDFNFRKYQILRTRKFIKKEFLILTNGSSQNYKIWLTNIKPGLHKFNLKAYKIFNKLALKVIKKSRYKNLIEIISGTFLLVCLADKKGSINKNILQNDLELAFFKALAFKLNNKIYSSEQLKKISSLKFLGNLSLLYQFLLLQLKKLYIIMNSKV